MTSDKKQPRLKAELKLVNSQGTAKGYIISNIKEVLGVKRFSEFEKWIFGQTVGMYKNV